MTTNPSQQLDQPPMQQGAAYVSSGRHVSGGATRDWIRWGPIWGGAIVAVPVFLVLQTFFFAIGAITVGPGAGAGSVILSAVLGLIAFFIGGLIAGAASMWPSMRNGLLHGVLVWALAVVGLLALGLFGGGALLGPLANLVGETAILQQMITPGVDIDLAQATQQAREAAGWAALGLGLAVAAAAVGGAAGSKMRPRQDTESGAGR